MTRFIGLPVLRDDLPRRQVLLLGAAAGVAACSGDDRPPPLNDSDAGPARDTGAATDLGGGTDTGPTGDAVPPSDTGPSVDAAATDAAATDAAATDAGQPEDAAATDASATDAGQPEDAAATDAGQPEDVAQAQDVAQPEDVAVATDTGPTVPAGYVRLAAVGDFAIGRWTAFMALRVIGGRDAMGLFAYSAVCTHSGCDVPAPAGVGQNSVCPCHMSEFDGQGVVQRGPAASNLVHHPLALVGSDVYVNDNLTVPAATRTPVP